MVGIRVISTADGPRRLGGYSWGRLTDRRCSRDIWAFMLGFGLSLVRGSHFVRDVTVVP